MSQQQTEGQNGSTGQQAQEKANLSSCIDVITAVMMAVCLYLPDQISTIAFSDLIETLRVPYRNTEVYMAKLVGIKAMANFIAAPVMLMVNLVIPANKWLATAFVCVMMAVRMCLLLVHLLPRPAICFYQVLVLQSFVRGLFENHFYPLAADHITWVLLSYKGSKVLVLLVQLILEYAIVDNSIRIIQFHLMVMLIVTTVSVGVWFGCYVVKSNDEQSLQSQASLESGASRSGGGSGGDASTTLSAGTSNSNPSVASPDNLALHENSTFVDIVCAVWSPMLMCLFGTPQKQFYTPWILPYGFIERRKCETLNIILMFMGLSVTTFINAILVFCRHLKNRWTRFPFQGHLAWLFLIPCISCMPIIFTALHMPGSWIGKQLHNNRTNVAMLYYVLIGSTIVLDNMGFIGVAACSKVNGKYTVNAKRVMAIAAFLNRMLASITYRIGIGYMLVLREYVDGPNNSAPTEELTFMEKVVFWSSQSMKYAKKDLIDEFKGNIKEVVKQNYMATK
ncbi:putative integral membrane protein [Babesia bovis T2Bo]|uniref:Uncharacterized protein n=1 Tax=Babesia bovis TaxID=5865 RepID=A7AP22_BABBO|nr:putative integral membrane protein [Babesia bovis T2Bo]EDO08306.1 putative integral membrane protein [Babesia bovis T2Bo]|eukprot:XP_001611874.1 hypothetical protein [Babesia bovis T2Bo]